ncbi:sodium/potassium-transporting ATPase subunit beta-1-interacting protein isoform X1 [Wyeomyia smithii]|uniref:sodium/potassium-transporting ATPase subunit beta-1-interacting protein isoform X1 n=1 Tax=Wyeomyia smithii TaxID=174621 RepID=UPI002467C70B|nr:sodium/potassium-transporting ATPase subunit beta-1-interacting protein isoform X1 [Wyeomyia smithii]
MGSCSRRQFLLSICFLQLLFIIERQVFDFLGYMWAPILANFFHIIFVIFGFFGAYQYRPKYLVTYSLWNLLWIGWNAFLICFYLNAGILDRDSDLLNLGTGSVSWFEVNGYGCKPTYPMNITSEDPYRPVRPERVDGCLLDYHIVEIVQSSLQCALALLGFFGAVCLGHTYLDEDDSFDFMGGDAKSPQHTAVHPMYVSYTSLPTTNSATSTQLKQANAASAAAKSAQSAITNSTTVITANKHNSTSNHCLNNTSSNKLGVVLMSINGHGNMNANSSSNTNTLLSSSSSPSSTFTNCNGNGSSSISGTGCIPPVGGLTHEAHVPLHQQPMPHLHPLSRNSSFSKTRSGQIRKNSSSASIRYTDVIQQQQQQDEQKIIPNDDDTFFIPKSSSCRNNFGISNPFNNVSSRYYRDGDGDSRADDDDNTRLITGSLQQLSVSTPLKRNPSITSNGTTGNDTNTTTPSSEKNVIAFERNVPHGTRSDLASHQHRIGYKSFQPVQPGPPPVPPLPQLHLQHHQFDNTENYRMPYQYITRSPNLNRIARRNNTNLINNNNSTGSSSSRVMSPKYCDQIRELGGPLPGYHGHENNNYPAPPSALSPLSGGGGFPAMVMHRAKSQDRLSHRSRRHHGGGARAQHGVQLQQRPRSFCSNNGIYPDYVIMEHPDS